MSPITTKAPRIDQILESFGRYDAIGNDVVLFRDLIRKAGYQSDIYSVMGADGHDSFTHHDFFRKSRVPEAVIHHFSIASNLVYMLLDFPGYKITRYHNITPAHYFNFPETRYIYRQCQMGRAQLSILREVSDTYLAASAYNAEELQSLNFPTGKTLPVLRRYDGLLEISPDKKILNLLSSGDRKNILFVGRIIPNKCQHDLIMMLHQYKKHYGAKARLILVGGQDPFYARTFLIKLLKEYQLSFSFLGPHDVEFDSDVIFAGGVDDHGLAAYYRSADAFVCMSEHEGFGVPLIEALGFSLPVLAHPAAAISETLGKAGVLVDKNDRIKLLEQLNQILTNPTVKQDLIKVGHERFRDFSWDKLSAQFSDILSQYKL